MEALKRSKLSGKWSKMGLKEIKIRVSPACGFIQVHIVQSDKAGQIDAKVQIQITQVHTNANTDQNQSQLCFLIYPCQHHIIAS